MVSDSSIHHIYQSGIIFDLAVRPRAHGKHNLSKLPLINSTLNTKTLTTKVILKHQSLLNRDFRSQGLEALVDAPPFVKSLPVGPRCPILSGFRAYHTLSPDERAFLPPAARSYRGLVPTRTSGGRRGAWNVTVSRDSCGQGVGIGRESASRMLNH